MKRRAAFLKISSVVVKVAAWISLFFGALSAIIVLTGKIPDYPRLIGVFILVLYGFFFFLLYLIAEMAGVLSEIAGEIKKE